MSSSPRPEVSLTGWSDLQNSMDDDPDDPVSHRPAEKGMNSVKDPVVENQSERVLSPYRPLPPPIGPLPSSSGKEKDKTPQNALDDKWPVPSPHYTVVPMEGTAPATTHEVFMLAGSASVSEAYLPPEISTPGSNYVSTSAPFVSTADGNYPASTPVNMCWTTPTHEVVPVPGVYGDDANYSYYNVQPGVPTQFVNGSDGGYFAAASFSHPEQVQRQTYFTCAAPDPDSWFCSTPAVETNYEMNSGNGGEEKQQQDVSLVNKNMTSTTFTEDEYDFPQYNFNDCDSTTRVDERSASTSDVATALGERAPAQLNNPEDFHHDATCSTTSTHGGKKIMAAISPDLESTLLTAEPTTEMKVKHCATDDLAAPPRCADDGKEMAGSFQGHGKMVCHSSASTCCSDRAVVVENKEYLHGYHDGGGSSDLTQHVDDRDGVQLVVHDEQQVVADYRDLHQEVLAQTTEEERGKPTVVRQNRQFVANHEAAVQSLQDHGKSQLDMGQLVNLVWFEQYAKKEVELVRDALKSDHDARAELCGFITQKTSGALTTGINALQKTLDWCGNKSKPQLASLQRYEVRQLEEEMALRAECLENQRTSQCQVINTIFGPQGPETDEETAMRRSRALQLKTLNDNYDIFKRNLEQEKTLRASAIDSKYKSLLDKYDGAQEHLVEQIKGLSEARDQVREKELPVYKQKKDEAERRSEHAFAKIVELLKLAIDASAWYGRALVPESGGDGGAPSCAGTATVYQ
ncbi:unnamed protein product [Amoebophrya sp. A120]|nr:unnamed protein product [Amoebophrya sp. A120]|eukprot:GSA120T00009638001.1